VFGTAPLHGNTVRKPSASPLVYDVRVDADTVTIRRDEDGGLRRNPISDGTQSGHRPSIGERADPLRTGKVPISSRRHGET